MGTSSKLEALRADLSDTVRVASDPFGILHEISSLVNNHATHHVGREMVIRALAMQDKFPPDHRIILQSLVTSVGLMPYLDKNAKHDLQDRLLIEAHRPPIDDPDLLFHTLQLQIYRDIVAGRNVVLSASTSVGKSLVVDAAIASGKYHHVAIIVPTIALIDETRRRLTERFGQFFDIVTHPSQSTEASRPTIFVLTQERAISRKDLGHVSFFVIDEFYKIDLNRDKSDRTVDLNLCFHQLAQSGAQFYLIGPNIDYVTGLGGKYEFTFIPSQFSTVALDFIEYDLPKDDEVRCSKLLEILDEHLSPTLVYCQSPAKAAKVAEFLIESGSHPDSVLTEDVVDWLTSEFPEEWVFIRALKAGIGIHHGNIPRSLQQYVVRAFARRKIRTVICTSTIIEGVNTVAENVVIYDKRAGSQGTPNLTNFTFKNIAGRAGRMNQYFVGKVFVLETSPAYETSYSVQVGIENQDHETPLSLIIDLDEEDLKPVSVDRLANVEFDSPISMATLKLNRHIPFEEQYSVHAMISQDLVMLEDALVWSGAPTPHQLLAVCKIIYERIDRGRSLNSYGITSGVGLKAELDRLRMSKSFSPTIQRWVDRGYEGSVSESVEKALKFMRRYVSFTFPRQLMAVSNIQAEIYRNAGREKFGDYSFFAATSENLFMEAGLFALDEYGIPPEFARRLGEGRGEIRTLDDGLDLVKGAQINSKAFHPFEKEILADVISSFG